MGTALDIKIKRANKVYRCGKQRVACGMESACSGTAPTGQETGQNRWSRVDEEKSEESQPVLLGPNRLKKW